MEFDKRLARAVERGQRTGNAASRARAEEAITEGELRQLHSACRLGLSERIDRCLRAIVDQFPGFEFESIVSDDGWGARVTRDDLGVHVDGGPESLYSRLEMLIRPFSSAHIVELTGKGTIGNREVFNRSHYQFVAQADVDSFTRLIDLWVLEYAEKYAVRTAS